MNEIHLHHRLKIKMYVTKIDNNILLFFDIFFFFIIRFVLFFGYDFMILVSIKVEIKV